jgi:hypothetical protein
MNEQLLITCKTCRYHEVDKNYCKHPSSGIEELSERCLHKIDYRKREDTLHPRYPYLTKKYNIHEYFYWEPKDEYIDNVIEKFLDKEDFEI